MKILKGVSDGTEPLPLCLVGVRDIAMKESGTHPTGTSCPTTLLISEIRSFTAAQIYGMNAAPSESFFHGEENEIVIVRVRIILRDP